MVIQLKFIDLTVNSLDWLIWIILYIRESLQPSPPIETEYQGGEALLPTLEVLKAQPALIALVGEKKAFILQKIHEWCVHNQRKGTHKFNGATWSHGSHDDWFELHFSWMNKRYLGRLLAELVADGFLFSTNKAKFCYKGQFAYRVNHLKIMNMVDWQQVSQPMSKSDTPPVTNQQSLCQKSTYNNIPKSRKQTNQLNQSETPTTPPARARTTHDDVDVGVENQDHDSGEFFSKDGESTIDDTATMESPSPRDETPPDSAPPPSSEIISDEHEALVRQIAEDLGNGLTETAVRFQIRIHGPDRCQAVSNWIYRNKEKSGIKNPPGFWIDELRENRLGIKNGYERSRWANFIKE